MNVEEDKFYNYLNMNINNKPQKKPYQTSEMKEVKTMILLKSLVFGLFIVFVTLLIAFFLIKNQRSKRINNVAKCSDYSLLTIDGEIEKIEFQNNIIVVISSDSSGQSKVITRIDANCGNKINHINLVKKQK